MWKNLFVLILAFGLDAHSAPKRSAKPLCYTSSKAPLAMDQRDDQRLTCLKKNLNKISISKCLHIANNMEYSITSEEARMACLFERKTPLNLQECMLIAKSMEYPDSGDEARWECLRRFSQNISKENCQQITKSMAYPPNEKRAATYCAQELKKK